MSDNIFSSKDVVIEYEYDEDRDVNIFILVAKHCGELSFELSNKDLEDFKSWLTQQGPRGFHSGGIKNLK